MRDWHLLVASAAFAIVTGHTILNENLVYAVVPAFAATGTLLEFCRLWGGDSVP